MQWYAHFTPTSAAGINQAERWFAELMCKQLNSSVGYTGSARVRNVKSRQHMVIEVAAREAARIDDSIERDLEAEETGAV